MANGLILTGAWAKGSDIPYGKDPIHRHRRSGNLPHLPGNVKDPAADWNMGQDGVQTLDDVLPTLDIGATRSRGSRWT